MKKFFLALFFSLGAIIIIAQEASFNGGKYVVIQMNNNIMTNLPKQKETPKGSVFLFDEYIKGTVLLRDSSVITDYKVNINLYTKQLEILNEDQISLLNYSKVDKIFVVNKGVKEYYTSCPNIIIQYPEIGDCSFIKVLYEGKYATLIDKVTLDLIPSNYNIALNAGNAYDTYIAKHNYYILKNGKALTIRLSRSSVLFVLKDKRKELNEFIIENNLNLRNTKDLTSVIKFYNNLYEQNTH